MPVLTHIYGTIKIEAHRDGDRASFTVSLIDHETRQPLYIFTPRAIPFGSDCVIDGLAVRGEITFTPAGV